MVVAYAQGLGSRWMALPADLRGVVGNRIWDRCGPRMGRDGFRPCAYPQVRALHLLSGCSIGYSKKRPQQDSNLRARLRGAYPCTAPACGNVIFAVAWGAYGGHGIVRFAAIAGRRRFAPCMSACQMPLVACPMQGRAWLAG